MTFLEFLCIVVSPVVVISIIFGLALRVTLTPHEKQELLDIFDPDVPKKLGD